MSDDREAARLYKLAAAQGLARRVSTTPGAGAGPHLPAGHAQPPRHPDG
jgi:hypothetical protein